jgi:hypothetical protein
MKTRVTTLALALATGAVAACGRADVATKEPNVQAMTVCEAALQPVGTRILVQGEFEGADYGAGMTITLGTRELCGERGVGLIFAELRNRDEKAKYANATPRSDRPGNEHPGDLIVVEGDVAKVDDGRFTTLRYSIIRKTQ